MTAVLHVASLTLREVVRKKVLLGVVALTLAFFTLYAIGVYFIFQEFNNSSDMRATIRSASMAGIMLAGLYVLNSIGGLLAIFSSVGSISQEIEQGTFYAIMPRPVHRWQVVLGKWLGYAVMLIVYMAIASLIIMTIVWFFGHFWPSNALSGIALMTLGTLLLLSMSVAGSAFLPTMANGVIVFIVYAVATLGGMIEQLGWLVTNKTMVNIGVISSLLMPTDAIWKMAAQNLQPNLPLGILSNVLGPFATLNPPSIWMAIYAAIYAGAALVGAIVIFQRRDL